MLVRALWKTQKQITVFPVVDRFLVRDCRPQKLLIDAFVKRPRLNCSLVNNKNFLLSPSVLTKSSYRLAISSRTDWQLFRRQLPRRRYRVSISILAFPSLSKKVELWIERMSENLLKTSQSFSSTALKRCMQSMVSISKQCFGFFLYYLIKCLRHAHHQKNGCFSHQYEQVLLLILLYILFPFVVRESSFTTIGHLALSSEILRSLNSCLIP